MSQQSYQHLAQEFMNLWQKQIASVVGDKQFIQSMLEMVESMKMPHAQHAAQPSHASDASGADASERVQLAYRLGQCERRIAALEKASGSKAGAEKTGRKPARGSKKTKQ